MVYVCPHCDEPVESDYQTVPHITSNEHWEDRRWHRECYVRAIVGGLNHLRGRCTCCGGTEPPDPPEMTIREAALAAYQRWMAQGVIT